MIKSKEYNPATFLIFRGLPGVGKTTSASEVKNRLGEQCIILDPDKIDRSSQNFISFCEQIPTQTPEIFFPYRYLLNCATEGLLRKKTVIWCQAWTKIGGMEKAISSLRKKVPSFDAFIIELTLPREQAKERLERRKALGGNCLDNRTLSDFEGNFEEINDDYLFGAAVFKINASEGVSFLVDNLFQRLNI